MNDKTDSCEEYQILMMGYIDGELNAEQEATFKNHVYQCSTCAEELTQYQKLASLTDSLKLTEPADYEWERIYKSLSYKIESKGGWFFVIVGTAIVFGYLLYELCLDWEISATLRIGIVTTIVGFCLLMISAIRQRLRIKKYERYEAVKR